MRAQSNEREGALDRDHTPEGIRLPWRLWRETSDPWHLTHLGCALFRANRTRRARVVLERATRMQPFHVLAASLLIQVAQAQGDHEGALSARNYALQYHGEELPPEPW